MKKLWIPLLLVAFVVFALPTVAEKLAVSKDTIAEDRAPETLMPEEIELSDADLFMLKAMSVSFEPIGSPEITFWESDSGSLQKISTQHYQLVTYSGMTAQATVKCIHKGCNPPDGCGVTGCDVLGIGCTAPRCVGDECEGAVIGCKKKSIATPQQQ